MFLVYVSKPPLYVTRKNEHYLPALKVAKSSVCLPLKNKFRSSIIDMYLSITA